MTTSLVVLYTTFFAGVAVLAAAWLSGDMPEQGYQFHGNSPLRPDLRHVVSVEETRDDDAHHIPAAPLGRHA